MHDTSEILRSRTKKRAMSTTNCSTVYMPIERHANKAIRRLVKLFLKQHIRLNAAFSRPRHRFEPISYISGILNAPECNDTFAWCPMLVASLRFGVFKWRVTPSEYFLLPKDVSNPQFIVTQKVGCSVKVHSEK